MSFFRASPFARRHPDPNPTPSHDLDPTLCNNNPHTPVRRSHVPHSAPRRSRTPSFSRVPSSPSSTPHRHRPTDPSRFGFSAFTHSHSRIRTPQPAQQPRTPLTYRTYTPRDHRHDHFDEDKISRTPAKGRNDEWLASLGFDLSLLELSAHAHDPAAENRHPNITHPPQSPQRTYPRKSTSQRLAMPMREIRQPTHQTSTTGSPSLSNLPSANLCARETDTPPPGKPHAAFLPSQVYTETSVSTDYCGESGQSVASREDVYSPPQAQKVGNSKVTVPEMISGSSPTSESSMARPLTPPPEAVVGTPRGPRRHTELAYETTAANDVVCRTPKSRPSSSMRDAPIGTPKTPRRHTDWHADSGVATDRAGQDAVVTPGRVRSARKGRRASVRVSSRELRALVEAQESMGIRTEVDLQRTPGSTRKTRAGKSLARPESGAGAKDPTPENLPAANFVLSPVRATKQQKEALGSDRIVTPVRRSLRISKRHVAMVDLENVVEHNAERLESADYAFLPNRNLKEKVDVERKNQLR